jgi:hypothetical protein
MGLSMLTVVKSHVIVAVANGMKECVNERRRRRVVFEFEIGLEMFDDEMIRLAAD